MVLKFMVKRRHTIELQTEIARQLRECRACTQDCTSGKGYTAYAREKPWPMLRVTTIVTCITHLRI